MGPDGIVELLQQAQRMSYSRSDEARRIGDIARALAVRMASAMIELSCRCREGRCRGRLRRSSSPQAGLVSGAQQTARWLISTNGARTSGYRRSSPPSGTPGVAHAVVGGGVGDRASVAPRRHQAARLRIARLVDSVFASARSPRSHRRMPSGPARTSRRKTSLRPSCARAESPSTAVEFPSSAAGACRWPARPGRRRAATPLSAGFAAAQSAARASLVPYVVASPKV